MFCAKTAVLVSAGAEMVGTALANVTGGAADWPAATLTPLLVPKYCRKPLASPSIVTV